MWKKKLTAFILALSMLACSFRVHAADTVLVNPGQMIMSGIDEAELDPFASSDVDTQFIPLIASGEAIAWLLAAFGLMGASAVYLDTDKFDKWSNGLVSAFMAYCTGREVVLASQASLWLANAAKGVIDKSSAVYQEFKSWASSLYAADEAITELSSASYEFDFSRDSIRTSGSFSVSGYRLVPGQRVSFFLRYNSSGTVYFSVFGFTPKCSIYSKAIGASDFTLSDISYDSKISKTYDNKQTVLAYVYTSESYHYWRHASFSTKDDMEKYMDSFYSHIPHAYGESLNDALSSWLSSHSSLVTYTIGENTLYPSSDVIKNTWKTSNSLKDVDIQIGNNSAAESIDIPWQDLLGKYESISAQLAQVSEGLISLDDALASVGAQIVAGQDVIAGDTDTDTDTDTDGSGGSNTEKPPSSKPAAYALDLTKYFPFCIPFDLYEFASILAADPQTPCFDLPLNLGSFFGTYTIRVDLSPFNGLAALIRLSVLFLFCTSLARATRDLIRA